MSSKMIKILSLVATAIGVAGTMLSNWVDDQKMNEKIEAKVNEAMAAEKNEES